MPIELKLPDVGEGIAEGEIVRWLVAEGAAVKEDDLLVEILTDKANIELPSPVSGTLLKILAQPGQVVKVGEPIALIEPAAGQAVAVQRGMPPPDRPAPASREATEPGHGFPSGEVAAAGREALATPVV
ncbi:MAG: biotin/lipoyl-containing protein, partial [Candidatus Deferrimicrobiaceae bacterium]